MKRKLLIMAIAACMAAGLTSCASGDEVNMITKEASKEDTDLLPGQEEKAENASGTSDENPQVSSGPNDYNSPENDTDGENSGTAPSAGLSGYIFNADGISGTVSMTVDIDSAPIIKALGEPESYFEAPSCAYQGIDKIYTYAHFEINTCQDGGTDKISVILFKDDLVSTAEGICIGSNKEDMERVYGTGYEVVNGAYTYQKDNMRLVFIITDGIISSIEYDSVELDLTVR